METVEMERIFGKVAQKVVQMIPEEWTKVFIYGEILEDVQKGFFYYLTKDRNQPIYSYYIPKLFGVPKGKYGEQREEFLNSLQELWEVFNNNGEQVWTSLTMILESTGKFKIDYDYEDLTEADDHERLIIWKYKYLGLTPEDEDDKEFLEEYLKNAKTDISQDI
ncbi:DUF600 family protein [Ruminiclostridium herbifermentans]|uniref:DUF600 family protein n=1 Tax=Ruminiclostridium herbifermentans TaxID=2488810 RepID=A0A4U7JFQ4_9FIRM|nr:immunity protein YezG family protein [Ruminiclostridium herbifermentans]QNU65821.1 DUF600 family protein [Ruminiclostridium herbifermentans]